ncbi:MAG: hypothetical protein Q4G22_12665 [Paracoccus sp. (in: a-proteobacteria)]|uniref:hypothetical protein n=1 Tax=Paracoccus sp. TaxID=267 RepID=UPI0026DECA08|nr:hypothetical protein [Paracoccus sp. (in: a-proteobacteria)]MDO5632671.1 hypothetical protein [Paracoccus sp. (in: a-proteobacteria)]
MTGRLTDIGWLSRVTGQFGWLRIFLAALLAVTLHVFAVMQGLASSVKILIGGQISFALAVQFFCSGWCGRDKYFG